MPESAPAPKRDDGTALINGDPWLAPFEEPLRQRFSYYKKTLAGFDATGGLLGQVSHGHKYFGFTRGAHRGENGVWYREWAPGARHLALIGDFNQWDRTANPMQVDANGVWSVFLPDSQYAARLVHGSHLKVHVAADTASMDRLPAYITRVEQDLSSHSFTGVYWNPPQQYAFRHKSPDHRKQPGSLRIYEAHVGMAQEEARVGTFNEFTQKILPRIASLGYNAVQLMAVMEHPYYGSFGYHVSNFYAVSSRFGTPEDLKALVDAAHGMNLTVLLDIIHSHAITNTNEGLNRFDGTDFQYFHTGPRGKHVAWDSMLFDYSKFEVLRFLLSNCRYWLEEFQFDGFRFDGVTSMLYLDHGLGKTFTRYEDYFGDNLDDDALAYLQLANELTHQIRPDAVTVAEDVSGMPGLARPVAEGGLGFDYRLAMGVPDYWIKLLKEKREEQWNLTEMYHVLLNRRHGEKHIGYVESHDQALVGDKTIAFWLMDEHMYWHMASNERELIVDRGLALHKMMRLLTFSLAGEGYLNFMGNEFGHPEWVDFPREGNNWSYQFARRQWSLADADYLRYRGLLKFDQALMDLDKQWNVLNDPLIEQLAVHEDTRQLAYRRGPLVFLFNFHASESYAGLRMPMPDARDYRVILNTDDTIFEGFGLVAGDTRYPWQNVPMYGRNQSIQVYLPCRSAQVLAPL